MGLISSHQVVLENEVVCLGFKKKVPITIALDIAKLLECNFTIRSKNKPYPFYLTDTKKHP